ncbi:MAG: polysaccharide deacetylase family protein [Clostridia bacterium]|nr:polysaccharide deacetylase family protein [Clostridia bacterium]
MRYAFLRFPGFRSKALTLSYDDGSMHDKRLIEILSANGLKGTFNINSGLFADKPGQWRMTAEESIALYTSTGNEVAVHGAKHLSLAEVDSAMAVNDVLADRIALEKLLGRPVKGMAYANGSFSDSVVDILKTCGILYSRTVVSTEKFDIPTDWLRLPATCHHANPRLMELAKQFIEQESGRYFWANTPRLFYLWGHSFEFAENNNWHIIEEFASYTGNRTDVWYATNMEIYTYVKAYEALQFAADGSFVYNPGSMDVCISYMGREFLVAAGMLVSLQ